MLDLEVAVQEIQDNQQGHRVEALTAQGELVVIRRAKQGYQVTFPDRPRREAQTLSAGRQQDEPGIVE